MRWLFIFLFSCCTYMSANEAPEIVDVILSDYPAQANDLVFITAVALDPEEDALEYRWRPGDGSPQTAWSTNPGLVWSYQQPGHYGVVVQICDTAGNFVVRRFTVTVADVPNAPPAQASGPMAIDAQARLLAVVNPDNNTVTAINCDNRTVVWEVSVPRSPRSCAFDANGDLWVSCAKDDQIVVITPGSGVVATVPLDYGSGPEGILFSPDGETAYVSLGSSGELIRIDRASRLITGTLPLGPWPRAMAMTGDGLRLLVTRFISGPDTGSVYDVDTQNFTLTQIIDLNADPGPDTDVSGRGVPNYLAGIHISPDGQTAWVSANKANTARGLVRDGLDLNHENTVRSVLMAIDMATGVERLNDRTDLDNSDQPTGMWLSPLGDYHLVAIQGGNELIVIDRFTGGQVQRLAVGAAPQGIVYDAVTQTVFIKNFLGRSVTAYSVSEFLRLGNLNSFIAETIPTVSVEMLNNSLLNGKRIFYSAVDTRMALDAYMSCATSHVDGGHDGRVFDFTGRGEGLRNTTTLLGKRGTGHGPVHWTGNFDEIQDFEHDIRGGFLGTGFLTSNEFHNGTRDTTLGDKKAGINADLDDLAAYVTSLDSVPRSPYRDPNGDLSAAALRGREVFRQLNCASCHAGSDFTDSALGVFHDVGTARFTSGERLGATLTGFDTPTLRGLWATAPYLHDGSAATLQQVFTEGPVHGAVQARSQTEQDDLIAFLLELDDQGSNPGSADGSQPASRRQITVQATSHDGSVVDAYLTPAAPSYALTGSGATVFHGLFTAADYVVTFEVVPVGFAQKPALRRPQVTVGDVQDAAPVLAPSAGR